MTTNRDNIIKLCKIRDFNRALAEFEISFEETYHIGLNEGMLLCTLDKTERLTSGEIAEQLFLKSSNTSKVIKSVENKGMISRVIGTEDKRQMYFSLTEKGREVLKTIKCDKIEVPSLLKDVIK